MGPRVGPGAQSRKRHAKLTLFTSCFTTTMRDMGAVRSPGMQPRPVDPPQAWVQDVPMLVEQLWSQHAMTTALKAYPFALPARLTLLPPLEGSLS